jgi:Ca-activated chloride channel family protein
MVWEHSIYLFGLVIIPLLILGVWFKVRSMRQRAAHYFDADQKERLQLGYVPTHATIKHGVFLLGMTFLIVALAGPKIGTEVREVKQRGVDMLIALDVSASMNAEDVRPSRLEKAKFEINRLIERLDGDRVGLIVFTGEAFLQSPMTLDYSALRLFLDIVSTDQMPSSATDFASALEVAEQAFNALDSEEQENPTASTAARVLLIISDGEDHEQEYEDALKTLTDAQVSIYTLGIGTTAGTTIPLYEAGTGELVGYKRDRQGKVVTTALQREALQQMAAQGGGSYYQIDRGNSGIDAFLARVDELEQGEFSSQEYADFKDQYQWLAALGLLFLLLSWLIPTYSAKKNSLESLKVSG